MNRGYRYSHPSRGGFSPFSGAGGPFHENNGRRFHQHNFGLNQRFGGAQKSRGSTQLPSSISNPVDVFLSSRTAPRNHNWEQETAGSSRDYQTTGLVVWVDGVYGEVLCEKNLSESQLHFFFDGATVIDGRVLAEAVREEQGLKPGTQIEFECRPAQGQSKTAHLIHIKKMSVVREAPKTRLEMLSMLSFTSEPHKPRLATDRSGDYVLVSPVLFSKEWALKCIHTKVIGEVPEYSESERWKFAPGKTFTGRVMTAPRWMVDGGGAGLNGRNVRTILIEMDAFTQTISGFGTISKVVPFQSVVITADDHPGEGMFFPIVALDRNFKQRLMVRGTRVDFIACRELAGFEHPWKVISAGLTAQEIYHPKQPPMVLSPLHIALKKIEQVKKDPLAEFKVNGVVELKKNDLEELLLSEPSDPVEAVCAREMDDVESTESVENEAGRCLWEEEGEPEHLIYLERSASPQTIRAVLGCSPDDADEVERSQVDHRFKIEYSCQTMTVAEKVAEEQKRQREEAEKELDEEELEKRRLRREEARGHIQKQTAQADAERANEEQMVQKHKKGPVRPFIPEIEGIRTISRFDDIPLIFNQLLIHNEQRKAADLAKKELEKQRKLAGLTDPLPDEPIRPRDGFWFRRKTQRTVPTVLVEELCSNRTEEEICKDYKSFFCSNSMTTVVLRNPPARTIESVPSEVKTMPVEGPKVEEEKSEEKEQEVEKEQIEVPRCGGNSIFQDEIIAQFIQSLARA